MPVQVTCGCGNTFSVSDDQAGKAVECPACGRMARANPPAARTLQYAAPGQFSPAGPITPPPAEQVRLPTAVADKLRQPGKPPCALSFVTHGADLNVDFEPAPVLQAFADSLAKKLKKKHDVQIAALSSAPATGGAQVSVRLIQMDQGNRWLRYFLGIFFGGTTLEIDGQVTGASGRLSPFTFKHRGRGGLFGGSSENLLKLNARALANKVGKQVLKAS